ncbi:MAG TPA: DUF1330 domain-containing protein [Polyangiaceae bacterium]|nr:DUF1330 domain-containing protein [Polyangiaceae bacterium]
MFDHVSLTVRSFENSLAFYRAILAPLGHEAQGLDAAGKSVGFGPPGRIGLWLSEGSPSSSLHLAFKSADRGSVTAFYEAALGAGGTSRGKPGLRPEYAEDYFAAYVLDPDGNNIEAVAHEAQKPVYYIGSYDIVDAASFAQYPPRVLALLPKYGGEVLASDTNSFLVEGSARTMNAVIRFPSRAAALGLYEDPEYQEAKRLRQRSTSNISMVLAREFGQSSESGSERD